MRVRVRVRVRARDRARVRVGLLRQLRLRVRVRARARVRVRVGLHLRVDDGARRELVRLEQWARVDLPPLALHALLARLGQMQRAEQLDLQLGELVRVVAWLGLGLR